MTLKQVQEKLRSGLVVSAVWEAGTLYFVKSNGKHLCTCDVDKKTAEDICELLSSELKLSEV
jgi:hypothetical protein